MVTEHDRARIIAARKRREWSMQDLARRTGIDRSTIHRLESGSLKSTAKLGLIYSVLGLPAQLLNKSDPEETELIEAFRRIRSVVPHRAAQFLDQARQWAADAEQVEQHLEAAAETEKKLFEGPNAKQGDRSSSRQ